MGIRKHFERKSPDEDLKLQDLSLEQEKAKPELKFDPETEISETDWQGMKDRLESYRNDNWWDFADQAMHLKILFPDRVSELDLNDSAWQGMKDELESYRQNDNWWSFAYQAMSLKILFPNKASELNLNDSAWQGMTNKLESYRDNDWWNFTNQAMRLKILFTDRVPELDLNDQAWKGMKGRLEEMMTSSYQARSLKIIFPEKMSGLNLNPVWQKTENALEKCRQNNDWQLFANLATNLKILAADKVEVTDQGLKITMPIPDFKSEKKPRPERRQF